MTTFRASLPLAAALAVMLASCSGKEKASLPPAGAAPRGVRVTRPASRIDTGLARATGVIRAKNEATLSAKATGQIRRIRHGVGDKVKTGTPLVEMDSANAVIALQNARAAERLAAANLAQAGQDLARNKVLFESGSLPEAGWEKVKTGQELAAAQLDQARAAVRAAEQALADTTILAPFDGEVSARHRNAGDPVTLMPITPILTLTDVDHLEVKLAVPEAIEPFAQVGQKVEGVITPSGQRFQAQIRVKAAVVDPATRTVEVLADVLPGEGPSLRPGALATVDLGGFGKGGGLFLPAGALRTDGSASWVFVVAGGKAERRDVDAAPVHPGTVSVKSGLDEKAEVILDPGSLAAGDPVVPLAD